VAPGDNEGQARAAVENLRIALEAAGSRFEEVLKTSLNHPGALLAIVLLWWAPRRYGKRVLPLAWAGLVAVLLVSQLAWIPIQQVFGPSEAEWLSVKAESVQVGRWYNQPDYRGFAIAVPEDRPDITYGLARFGYVEGKHLVSEMYDPFAYLPSNYGYAQNATTVDTLVQCWLSTSDVRLIAIPDSDPNLARVVQDNPAWFTPVGFMAEARWTVDGVTVPRPSSAQCRAAQAAVH